jgi:hypothetical protein
MTVEVNFDGKHSSVQHAFNTQAKHNLHSQFEMGQNMNKEPFDNLLAITKRVVT